MDPASESRILMKLDAGGTYPRVAAMRGGKPVTEMVSQPSNGDDLARCLANIVEGFIRVKALCPEPRLGTSGDCRNQCLRLRTSETRPAVARHSTHTI